MPTFSNRIQPSSGCLGDWSPIIFGTEDWPKPVTGPPPSVAPTIPRGLPPVPLASFPDVVSYSHIDWFSIILNLLYKRSNFYCVFSYLKLFATGLTLKLNSQELLAKTQALSSLINSLVTLICAID